MQLKKNNKILFIGRKDCQYTNKAIKKLKNFGWKVDKFLTNTRNQKLPKNILSWKGDYIFSFRSYVIIPNSLLKRAKKAAINFHPSTPKYRGSGGINFALYNKDKKFGCTSHLIEEKIDSGKIILVNKFNILKNDNVEKLAFKTYKKLLELFYKVVSEIYKNDLIFIINSIKISKKEVWGGKLYKIKDVDNLQKISKNFSKVKLEKIIRSTHTAAFPSYIYLHGMKFILEK